MSEATRVSFSQLWGNPEASVRAFLVAVTGETQASHALLDLPAQKPLLDPNEDTDGTDDS